MEFIMTLGERIKEERLKKDVSQATIAELCCVSQQAVGKWEKESASPSLETLQVLADYFGVTVDYLLCRDNKKTLSENGERKGVRIPVYGRIAAGIPISAIQEIIDYEEIPEDMLQHGEYIALKVKGDSMEPRIADGDVVIIRVQETVENGEVAAVYVNGNDVTLKRLRKENNGIWLIGNNPAFQPIFYSRKDCEELPVRILGKMVELRGKGKF